MSWKKRRVAVLFSQVANANGRDCGAACTVSKRVTCITGHHSGIVWRGWVWWVGVVCTLCVSWG